MSPAVYTALVEALARLEARVDLHLADVVEIAH